VHRSRFSKELTLRRKERTAAKEGKQSWWYAVQSIMSDAALLSAFSPLEHFSSAAIAVSGGPDSIALMHLARRWAPLARNAPSLTVITVDHGLRPESRAEAEFVRAQAQRLRLACIILTWAGAKPKTGIQAAARRARYDLMMAHCRAQDIACLVTAHNADDQAETFLMRLRRGSGLDGLAAMATVSEHGDVPLVRPLLRFSKARLAAYLRSEGLPFVRDPANVNMAFERVRLRHAMRALASAGVAPPALVLSTARLGRARHALSHAANAFLEQNFLVTPLGQGEIGLGMFQELSEDIALRVLSQALALIGGRAEPPRMAKAERLLEGLRAGKREAVLGGCLIIVAGGKLRFYREPGRTGGSAVVCEAGSTFVWDGRFVLTFAKDFEAGVSVAPLGEKGWAICRQDLKMRGIALPGRLAALTTPALWREGRLLCAPHLTFTDASLALGAVPQVTAELVPRLSQFLGPG
jgi:tRNA(Ile)-lysidine synthase